MCHNNCRKSRKDAPPSPITVNYSRTLYLYRVARDPSPVAPSAARHVGGAVLSPEPPELHELLHPERSDNVFTLPEQRVNSPATMRSRVQAHLIVAWYLGCQNSHNYRWCSHEHACRWEAQCVGRKVKVVQGKWCVEGGGGQSRQPRPAPCGDAPRCRHVQHLNLCVHPHAAGTAPVRTAKRRELEERGYGTGHPQQRINSPATIRSPCSFNCGLYPGCQTHYPLLGVGTGTVVLRLFYAHPLCLWS